MTGENRGRGRPRKTESTYADTRNDLIRSGLELLTQNGFLATGVDAIVKNANVPKGSFYYYFKSKEDYAQTVLNAYDSFFEHKLKKHLHESSCTPMVRLENFINDACEGIKKIQFYPRLPGWKYDAGESGAFPNPSLKYYRIFS
ncbi:TetR/AcrR family transcriptional regulator [Escherichia coli]|nr:TetR/AcrR family transcriptional regulator [Escherichia coli]